MKSQTNATSWIVAFAIAVSVPFTILSISPKIFHWFLIVHIILGTIILRDIVDWLRGVRDTFDPLSIVALISFRGFMGALARFESGNRLLYVEYPPEWRPWIGFQSAISIGCYLIIRMIAIKIADGRPLATTRYHRVFNPIQYLEKSVFVVSISAIAFAGVLVAFGGVSGYVDSYESRSGFQGMGLLFMISEPLPILILLAYIMPRQARNIQWSAVKSYVFLAAFFVFLMLVGGLRGSRSNVVWNMFWAVGILHYSVRRFSRKEILAMILCAMVFIAVYGIFKRNGVDGFLSAMESSREREEMVQGKSGDGKWYDRIAGGGTTTYTLYKIYDPNSDYEYAYGRTYFASVFRFVPRFIYAHRPPGKRKYGTEILYGKGSWPSKETSLVWGLRGEAMLNFGMLAVPFFYIIPGCLLGRIMNQAKYADSRDMRRLLLPFWTIFLINVIGSDSESLPFAFFKQGMMPILFILWCSRKAPRETASVRNSTTDDYRRRLLA